MSSKPNQTRTVDAFSSYHSNIVNRLTRIISDGEDVIIGNDSLSVSIMDSTNLNLSSGFVIKDDVLIEVTSNFNIDLESSDLYYDGASPLPEEGLYYIVLDYTYEKTKPAPEANIVVLTPSQTNDITYNRFLFLQSVDIIDSGSGLVIDEIYGYDPNDKNITRNYVSEISQGHPYKSKLILDNLNVFRVESNYGCVVPERYTIEDNSELIIEDDAAFVIV